MINKMCLREAFAIQFQRALLPDEVSSNGRDASH